MIEIALFLLILFQIKHWYIDFVDQTEEEIKHKSLYLNWIGVKHSLKHGVGTLLCLWTVTGWDYVEYAFFVAVIDFILHYHIDWAKMNYGNRDITTHQFWNHLGLDQMAHQLCYIAYAGFMVL